MIKKVVKLVSKLRPKSKPAPTAARTTPKKNLPAGKTPVIRSRPQHCISRKNISAHALKVLSRLQNSGYTAYLVGGSVRDLLLAKTPKDFDVSTDAHPNQIKRLFRNCWLIGRRFRLAHIKFGKTIIETSTFRKIPPQLTTNGNSSEDLLVRSDNTFGTPEEDAFRRDFTINGLFYDSSSFSVIDYVGGLTDLDKRVIRAIGDPQIRFREDPIRMLRAVRFAARLDFKIERKTRQAILDLAPEITKAASARLVEEFYKFFGYGAGEAAIRLLHELGLLRPLIPCLDEFLAAAGKKQQVRYWSYLRKFDQENLGRDTVDIPLAFAVLLYPMIYDTAIKTGGPTPRLALAARTILAEIVKTLMIPRRIRENIGLIFSAQDRFMAKRRRRFNRQKFIARRFFRDALTLYGFAVEIEGFDPGSLQKWQRLYAEYKPSGGIATPETIPPRRRPKRRKPNAHRSRRGGEQDKPRNAPAQEHKVPRPAANEDKDKDSATRRNPKPRRGQRRPSARPKNTSPSPAPAPEIFLTGKEGQEPTNWMDEI